MKRNLFFTYIIAILNIYIIYGLDIPKIKLNTGKEVPVIGLGTWQATGKQVVRAVKNALAAGYRHIDTAYYYKNEREVGQAVQESVKAGVVKRADIFITTKVWPSDLDRKKALNMIRRSLRELNTTYIDLVLVHFPYDNYTDIYKGLEDAYNKRIVRSIGVSNFDVNHLKTLMKTSKVRPAMNQIEIHPKLNQDETVEYCKKLGIAVTGYSPLGLGSLIGEPTLVKIGKQYNKTSAQVMIRWQIQRGLIVIPKSVHKKRIIENFNVFDFELSDKDMKTIHNMR